MRFLAFCSLGMVAGCFSPTFPSGLACGPEAWCPGDQTCNLDNLCVEAGGDVNDAGKTVDAQWPDAGRGQLTAISIGEDVSIPRGAVYQFAVTATYENGSADVTEGVIWQSSDNAVVTVDFNNRATTHSLGSAVVTAQYQGRSDLAIVTVTDTELVGLEIVPAQIELPLGQALRLQAFAVYTDATRIDVSGETTFVSSEPGLASISGATVTGAGAGMATVMADWNGQTTTAAVTVSAATITALSITPDPAPGLLLGQTRNFTATATFADATTFNVTKLVTWSTSDPSTVTISNGLGSQGVAAAHASGTAAIDAQLGAVSAPSVLQLVF